MSEEGPREDCDPQCKGYNRQSPCCGGCPVQCYCRMESEADYCATRESFDLPDDYEPLDFAESDYGDGEGA